MLLGAIILVSVAVAALVCLLCGGFSSLAWLWILPLTFAGSFVLLALLAFLFLLLVCKLVDIEKPQTKDSRFYRFITNLYIEAVMQVLGIRVETEGLEKRPKSGRFMLVCNHLHEIDPAVLLHFFRRNQLAFISKRENANMFIIGKLMHKLMCQMINRENDREALKTILKCIQLLKEDQVSVAVFPEGYINEQRKFKHLKPGVFKIAQKANVPIVVCTLRDTHLALGQLKKLKRPTVTLHVLEVIPAEFLQGKSTVEISDYVYGIMAADLGPENCYVEENT